MIAGFTGMPGTGKTAALAWVGMKVAETGRPVLANFQADFAQPWNPYEPPPSDERGFLLLIHEAGVLLDSRHSGSPMNTAFTRWLAQVRKIDADLIWDAQLAGQPDTRLRQFTDLWFQTTWHPSQVKLKGQAGYFCRGVHMTLPIAEAFPHYDTRESVDYDELTSTFKAKRKVSQKQKEKQLKKELSEIE